MTATTESQAPATPAALPLFYRRPVPLSQGRHGTSGIRPDMTLAFARQTNALTLVLEEVFAAAADYPLVFMKAPVPAMVAVVGLNNQSNLFVDAEGKWRPNTYVPAYVRRYPFIFAQTGEAGKLMLCVDEEAVSDQVPEGQRFFTGDEPSEATRHALGFCQNFQAQHERATAFVQALIDQDLLVERNAEVQFRRASGASRAVLTGLYLVDEAKFNALPDDVFLEWRRRGWVAAVHAHLLSQSRWRTVLDLAAEQEGATGE